MSLLTLSLALAAAQPVAEPPAEHEIEVIANKLRDWHGSWKLRKGTIACKTKRSTGDKAIDAIGCDALVQCVTPIVPQLVALSKTKQTSDEATRQVVALHKEAGVYDCVFEKRKAGIAALVAARRGQTS